MTADYTGKRVGVLMGGISSEREVSLNSGRGVLAALLEKGYDAVGVDWTEGADPAQLLRDAKVDVVWIALHGTLGEDGAVQGLLECLRIPYTGSGVMASAIAMDKVVSKRMFEAAGVPTTPWRIVAPDATQSPFGYPCVVKPSCEGSSVGVTIVRDESQYAPAVKLAAGFHGVVIVETYLRGAEVNVGIVDDEILGSVEIRPKKEFYDYEAKYLRDDTEYLVPAPLEPDSLARTCDACLRAHRAVGAGGYSRVDAIVDGEGNPYLLEVNTLPGMTDHSLLPKIARHAGMTYADLVVRILRSARLRA